MATTFFYGLTDHTLYTDSSPGSYHRKVLREHPEMVRSILPADVFRRHEAGEFLGVDTGNPDDERYSGSANTSTCGRFPARASELSKRLSPLVVTYTGNGRRARIACGSFGSAV